MTAMGDRFGGPGCKLAQGWRLKHLVPPSRLHGANGIRTGADGRIYVAQLAGCRVSAVDPDTAAIEHLTTSGSQILGPDDLVFDDAGNMYITEFTEHRVSVRGPNGASRILQGDIPCANPITFHDGHLLAGECKPDARILELDRNGGAPRVIASGIPMVNAFEVGPDGRLYFPVMGTSEIWRIDIAGGEPEVVAGGLGMPDSVKFDSKGFIVSTQVGSGQVLRIDPRNGERTVLADIGPGLDNCTFVGDRLFVSHMTGSIHEILEPGVVRPLVEKGLLWPMGIAVAADGAIYVSDGSYAYASQPGGALELAGMLFSPGYPGLHRGVAPGGESGEWLVTTSTGEVSRFWPARQENVPLAEGYDLLMGIAAQPGGRIVFAEAGKGRVLALEDGAVSELATGLDYPTGVALAADGSCYVAESGAGKVLRLTPGGAETILDGMGLPEGLAIHDGKLYVIDVERRLLLQCGLDGDGLKTIVSGLPVGAPAGPRPYLGPAGFFSGPMLYFAGLAAGPDGTLYVGADGEGSVIALHPGQQ
jgi:sugar lactone lactonase YvrE